MRLTLDQARAVEREPINVGDTRTFYCEMFEDGDDPAQRLRNYTGQDATVIEVHPPGTPGNQDPESSTLYRVRFADGREASAWEEELNGWDRDLGQFVGPSGEWGSTA